MSRYAELKKMHWSQFLELTGVVVKEFEQYLPHFTVAYYEVYPVAETNANVSRGPRGNSDLTYLPEGMEDKLLLIWSYHKMQLTPSALAEQFGRSQSQIDACINHLLPVLQLTFAKLTVPALQPFCIQFLKALNTYQVEYLIVGGYAVAFHGYRRPTLDLDVFISTSLLNAQKLVRVLQSFEHEVAPQILDYFQMEQRTIQIGMPPFTVEHFAPEDRFIQIGSSPKQLEIITSLSAVTFEECYPERVSGMIDGVPVQIIGLTQLKRNKQASIRLKDADDFAHLA